MTSGGAGQIYGSHAWASLANGFFASAIDSTGAMQLEVSDRICRRASPGRIWCPESVAHARYGRIRHVPNRGRLDRRASTRVTDVETSDQRLALAYLPDPKFSW